MADEVVSVALWRGYLMGCFYARPADRDVAVALSPSFRIVRLPWESHVSLERNRTAVGALDALQKTLREAGWQRVSAGTGSRWYQLAFCQPRRGGLFTPRPRRANGARFYAADRVRDAQADTPDLAEPTVDEPTNGHAAGAVAREIVAALRDGPLASNELCRRVGRPSGVVRVARRELELAGLVQKAVPPAGRSRRPTYWQLSDIGPRGLEHPC